MSETERKQGMSKGMTIEEHIQIMCLGIRFFTKGSKEETERSFRKHLTEYSNEKISSLELQLREKEEHYRKLEVVANRWHNEYLSMSAEKDQELHEKDREIERLKEHIGRLESSVEVLVDHHVTKLSQSNNDLRDALREIFPYAIESGHGIPEELEYKCRKLIE